MEGRSKGSGSEETILYEREQDKGIPKRREHQRENMKQEQWRQEGQVSFEKEEQGTSKKAEEKNTRTEWKRPDSQSTMTIELGQTKLVLTTTALTRNKAQLFPTSRRPERTEVQDDLLVANQEVEKWVRSTSLRLGEQLTASETAKGMRML